MISESSSFVLSVDVIVCGLPSEVIHVTVSPTLILVCK